MTGKKSKPKLMRGDEFIKKIKKEAKGKKVTIYTSFDLPRKDK